MKEFKRSVQWQVRAKQNNAHLWRGILPGEVALHKPKDDHASVDDYEQRCHHRGAILIFILSFRLEQDSTEKCQRHSQHSVELELVFAVLGVWPDLHVSTEESQTDDAASRQL